MRTNQKTLFWSEKDLKERAKITAEDVVSARLLWDKYAPRGFRDILDARPEYRAA